MIHKVLRIGRWEVDFLFATGGYDTAEALTLLRDCGASRHTMRQAGDLMKTCGRNCGFTYANPDALRAVVVVGPATGGDEFLDTLVHEIHHLAVAIADNLGLDLEGEGPAYLSGDTARDLAGIICELGCPHCH